MLEVGGSGSFLSISMESPDTETLPGLYDPKQQESFNFKAVQTSKLAEPGPGPVAVLPWLKILVSILSLTQRCLV